jgi:hypothetical protein
MEQFQGWNKGSSSTQPIEGGIATRLRASNRLKSQFGIGNKGPTFIDLEGGTEGGT